MNITAMGMLRCSLAARVYLYLALSDDDDATNTVIPAESTIKLAKERRVRAQANKGSEDDFISLSVTRREVTDDGPHPESRLVREEDELGEADDGKHLSTVSIFYTLNRTNRVCRVHQRTGASGNREKVEKG